MIKIAVYGKGGIGKSTTVSNVAAALAEQGLKVLQIGCDPKADSTILLRHGEEVPTVLHMYQEKKQNLKLEDIVKIGYKGIDCVEAGGPTPGLGCAGRGIITALEKLEETGAYEKYQPDVVLYDVLGDVVCGGFSMPMRNGYADKIFIVTSGENMAIHAGANIAMAVENFKNRGYATLGGLILNRRNVPREEEKVEELAEDFHTSIVGTLTRSDLVQQAEEQKKTVLEAFPESEMAEEYRILAKAILMKVRENKRCQMLRKVGESAWPISEKDAVVSIKDASYPIPFPQGLEFNSPAHGCWNIVHTGMLIPEAHQIYVCADNCMRGVVLTAAEMHAEDRFSFVIVEEQNLLSGDLEDLTIEGTADILRKLKEREEKTGQKMPKAVLLFTVCLHHFLGCDLERIYRELEQRFPEIRFLRCYMDPIMQKHGPTPDQKLRKAMYEPLNPDRNKMDTKQISILGSDFALDLSCDLKELLAIAGYKVRELQDCSTWEEYEELGNAGTFLCCYPSGKYGIETLAERLRRAFLYLPLSFDYEEIRSEEETLWNSLGVEGKQILSEWMEKKIALCEEALNHAKQIIGNAPITIDYTFHPRPLGLARLLLIHGFNVKTVFLDSISPEEKEVFEWLKVNAPKLELRATVHAKMRVLHEAHPSEKTLAIGQKAAWSTGSHYFVNLVQGASLQGFDGIRRTAELMEEAFLNKKDPKTMIVRKGWGCTSCI